MSPELLGLSVLALFVGVLASMHWILRGRVWRLERDARTMWLWIDTNSEKCKAIARLSMTCNRDLGHYVERLQALEKRDG